MTLPGLDLESLNDLLNLLEQNVGVVLLEDQHGTQANSRGATATDVDTERLGLGNQLVTLGGVPGDEGTLVLTTQVLEVLGVLLGEAVETTVEVITGGAGVLDKAETLNLFDDAAEDQSAGWVTHPGVELAVGLVGAQSRVAEVVTGSLGLLGEGNHVRGGRQVPVVVCPELSGCTNTGLHLIDDEEDVRALGDVTQALEESRGGMVVTTLGLNGLDHHSGNGVVELLDKTLNLSQAALLFGSILLHIVLEGVFELGEGSLGPVKGGDVQLVNGLAAGGGQGTEETAVECRLEGENRQLGRARARVVHGGKQLFLGELNLGATALQLAVVHEGGLVGRLVGIGASHGSENLVQSLGGSTEDTTLESVSPVGRREVAQGRTVDQGGLHLGRGGRLLEVRVVVTNGDGSNLSIPTKIRSCPFD
jgi:hypothetical protein